MNIVLLTPRVWDSTWGQEKNLVEELSKHHQLTVLDLIDYGFRYASKFQGQSYETPEGVTILKRQTALQAGVLLGVYTEFKNLWDFLLLKKARQADVVISYLTAGCLFMLLAAKLLRKNILLIYADDYAEFFRSKSSLVGWFTEHIGTPLAAKLADRVVTTAHKLKEDVISFNPNTIVIPNG
ncbi:MAG: glycosyltransferase family 4 protein, partial [bacterium]|nr:glycosyltransferase family 4 protein [bacterium]